jgi:hypothetical protein
MFLVNVLLCTLISFSLFIAREWLLNNELTNFDVIFKNESHYGHEYLDN